MIQHAAIEHETTIDDELVTLLVHQHREQVLPGLERLWAYYRNELDYGAGDEHRPYRAAQQRGLPARLTRPRIDVSGGGRREIVIENDIAWRVHTLVDFMFGKPIAIQSLAADRDKARLIERALGAAFDANGGVCFFQDLALLGSVYGHVDVLLRAEGMTAEGGRSRRDRGGSEKGMAPGDGPASNSREAEAAVIEHASRLVLETVEAPRAIPILDPADYRRLIAYIVHYTQVLNRVDRTSFLARLIDGGGSRRGRQATVDVTELWTAQSQRLWRDGEHAGETTNTLGRLPIVHMQNLPQPLYYEGLSEVEPLIPLQDELNTRLSDRANRVTLQSFKMYLGKRVERFIERPIGPGQMWMTDDPEASIESFGGDAESPSESAHIEEIREAMDKMSGVTPVAAGLLRQKVGNLTSENALRITLMGLLAKTEKKRVTYGRGIAALCELMLHALDAAGVLRTTAEDRRVSLHWPSAIPEDESKRLRDAQVKLELGVPREQVLAELGYGECDA